MVTLAVIASDPLEAYEAKGTHVWLERYYNPGRYFDKVYLLSPLEKRERTAYGMHIIPTEPRELPGRLRELGVDALRAYGGYWACDMACRNKARGVPVVVSVHDTNPKELYPAIKHADYVFCMSEAVRDLVLTRFRHPERAWILPNRYDSGIMRPMPGEDFSDLDRQFRWKYRLLCVGRLSEQKNQDTLIRSLAVLGPSFGCVFVGRNDSGPLRRLADSLGVTGQVRFVDSVRNDLLARYYNWADAMVTPSRWEGFGVVFIEALACGAVVITSNVRPMSEYIVDGKNGLLVDDFEDPRALAGVIRHACTDHDLRARLRERAPRSVERFELNRVDTLEGCYYTRVLAANGVERGLGWIRRHSAWRRGVCHSSHRAAASPLASGSVIPTLLNHGETRLAAGYARWLIRTQNGDGSWNGPGEKAQARPLDTGQALKGLMAIAGRMPEAHGPLRHGCDWLASRIGADGRIETAGADMRDLDDGEAMPDSMHLYTLEPLVEAARRFNRPDYAEAVRRALAHYKRDSDLGRFKMLAPFHACVAEALVDLRETALAEGAMSEVEALQREDGSVPALPGVDWVCPEAVAHYALVWLKMGRQRQACRAMKWLAANQKASGGFAGSAGAGAGWFADAEMTGTIKYFLDVWRRLGRTDEVEP